MEESVTRGKGKGGGLQDLFPLGDGITAFVDRRLRKGERGVDFLRRKTGGDKKTSLEGPH